MIIKILSNKGFGAFDYNNHKIEKGHAEITAMENFNASILGMVGKVTGAQCFDILKYQDGLRSDSKNTQIHVTISSHGREDDKKRLTECAIEYMKRMGYEGQPFLVYFHKDTQNNHVHIVSTRVKLDRTLISDSNEKKKSVEICRDFNQRYGHSLISNVQQQFRSDCVQVLQWSFADEKSFIQLMETFGYKCKSFKPGDSNFIFIKDGSICGKIAKDKILPCMRRYADGISFRKNKDLDVDKRSPIYKRKQLIYAKMTAYNRKGYTLNEIENLEEFRKQLGIKLYIKLREDKSGNKHLAWMCQDYPGKTFYKGSDIMNLDGFSLQPDIEVKKDLFTIVAPELMYDGTQHELPWREARTKLRSLGYELIMYKGRGRIRVVGSNSLFDVPSDLTRKMMRQQRIADVKALPIHSIAEARVLAMLNFIPFAEIAPAHFVPVDLSVRQEIADIIRSIISNDAECVSQKLKEEGIHAIASGENLYFMDVKHSALYSTNELDIPITLADIEKFKIKFISMDYLSANYESWTQLGENADQQQLQEESRVLSSQVDYLPEDEEELKDRARRGEEPLGGYVPSLTGDAHSRTTTSIGLFDILLDICMGVGQNLASYQQGAHDSKKDRKKKERDDR